MTIPKAKPNDYWQQMVLNIREDTIQECLYEIEVLLYPPNKKNKELLEKIKSKLLEMIAQPFDAWENCDE